MGSTVTTPRGGRARARGVRWMVTTAVTALTVAGLGWMSVRSPPGRTPSSRPSRSGNTPTGVAITPNGARAYVTNENDATVLVIETATNSSSAARSASELVRRGVAITPDGTRVYVTNFGDDTVSVIETATNTVIGGPIAVGTGPLGVAITPNGAHAYITDQNDNTVSVIAIDSAPCTGSLCIFGSSGSGS